MKGNKWGLYLGYGVLLLVYIIFGHVVLEYLNAQRIRTFVILPYEIGSTIIYSVGGMLLGIETFILEVKKKGKWKVNWPKVLFVGIPVAYIAFGVFIGQIPIPFVTKILGYPFSLLYFSKIDLVPLVQMAFGYIFITSFFKIEK